MVVGLDLRLAECPLVHGHFIHHAVEERTATRVVLADDNFLRRGLVEICPSGPGGILDSVDVNDESAAFSGHRHMGPLAGVDVAGTVHAVAPVGGNSAVVAGIGARIGDVHRIARRGDGITFGQYGIGARCRAALDPCHDGVVLENIQTVRIRYRNVVAYPVHLQCLAKRSGNHGGVADELAVVAERRTIGNSSSANVFEFPETDDCVVKIVAHVSDAVIVKVSLVRVGDVQTVVAGVACSVAIHVLLSRVIGSRADVFIRAQTISVFVVGRVVRTEVTGIADGIQIGVSLVRVDRVRAVVSQVRHAVFVGIRQCRGNSRHTGIGAATVDHIGPVGIPRRIRAAHGIEAGACRIGVAPEVADST